MPSWTRKLETVFGRKDHASKVAQRYGRYGHLVWDWSSRSKAALQLTAFSCFICHGTKTNVPPAGPF